jgi:aminopeptidase YwaD
MPGAVPRLLLALALLASACSRPAAEATALRPAPPVAAQPETAAAPTAPASGAQDTAAAEPAGAFSGTLAKQHVEALASQIGSRPAGSASYDAAIQYVSEQLRGWGYEPRVQEFPLRVYDDRGSRVALVSPEARVIDAATMQLSPAGEAEAPVVDVGLGRPEDVPPAEVQGKIALIRRGVIPFRAKVANAATAGAVAVIIYNQAPGRIQGSLGEPGPIPTVGISGEEGEALVRRIADGPVVLRVAVDASIQEASGFNVVATRPGAATGAGAVVIGGHLDSVPAGPGANDNASGTAVVLELARVLSTRPYPYTLKFVAFGAEELGLFGSRHFVEQLSADERRSIVAMINLDMVGVGEAWRFGGSDGLVQRAEQAAAALGAPYAKLGGPVAGASDHASFLGAGIPAVFVHRVTDPNYHTAGDRPEYVDSVALGQAGGMVLRLLEELAAPQP